MNPKLIIMKKITFFLAIVLSVFIGNNAIAQDAVTKAEVLNALNKMDDLGLSNEQSSALKDYNKKFTDDIFDITNSNKSDDLKITDLKNLRDRSHKELSNLLGDNTFKKFKKSIKKELKPLKRRSKLLKFII